MAHILFDHASTENRDALSVLERVKYPVPEEWLAVTAQANKFVERHSRRSLRVRVAPGMAHESGTALWIPHMRVIEIDADRALPGVHPESVDLSDDLFIERHARYPGMILHEVGHALFSWWVPEDLLKNGFSGVQVDVLSALDESAVELHTIKAGVHPRARSMLSASAVDIVCQDFTGGTTKYSASIGAALTLARIDAGSMFKTHRDGFYKALVDDGPLTPEIIDSLQALWRRYHLLPTYRPHHDYMEDRLDQLRDIANGWLDLVMDHDHDHDGSAPDAVLVACSGVSVTAPATAPGSDQTQTQTQGPSPFVRVAFDERQDAKERNVKRVALVIKRQNEERKKAADEFRNRSRDVASEVFPSSDDEDGKRTTAGKPGVGYSMQDIRSVTSMTTWRWRTPVSSEQVASARLAAIMEDISYVDRTRSTSHQVLPGGRLDGRRAVARAAQAAHGYPQTAEPWKVKKWRHNDIPRVRIGLMLDSSGSMNVQAQLAASLAYIVGNATGRIRNGADFAMVCFGKSVVGLFQPGQEVRYVPEVNSLCPNEAFSSGLHALNGIFDNKLVALGGSDAPADGLNILVMLTDGMFVLPSEREYADFVLPIAERRTAIVHVDVAGRTLTETTRIFNPRHNMRTPPLVIPPELRSDPIRSAELVGNRVAELVSSLRERAQVLHG